MRLTNYGRNRPFVFIGRSGNRGVLARYAFHPEGERTRYFSTRAALEQWLLKRGL